MILEEFTKLFVPTIENINILLYLTMFVQKWRFSKKITVTVLGCLILFVLMPYNVFCTIKFGTDRATIDDFTIVAHIFMLTVLMILGRMQNGRLLFQLSVAYMLVYLSGILTRLFDGYSYYFQCIARLFVFCVFCFLNYRYHRKYLFSLMDWIDRGWYYLSLIPISVILCCLYTFSLRPATLFHYAVCLQGFLIYFILLWVFNLMKKQQKMRQEDNTLRTHVNVFRHFYDQIADWTNRSRILRHDVRHYTRLIRSELSGGHPEEALEIVNRMEEKFTNTNSGYSNFSGILSPEVFQGPSMINALLAFYVHQAERYDISTKVSVSMPETPGFDLLEFSVFLSNSLENAIAACLQVSSPEKRRLVINADTKQEQFFFEVKNTYHGTILFENGIPVTQEPGHGFGVRSLCAFAQKYNALLDFQAEGGWFRVRILL